MAISDDIRAALDRGELFLEYLPERGVPDRLGLDALNLMAERGVRLALRNPQC